MNIYRKIALGLLVCTVLAAGVFSFTHVLSPSVPDNTAARVRSAEKTADAAKNTEVMQSGEEKYFLTLEDGRLCAYRITDGQKELIRSDEAETILMSDEEAAKLANGIYADTFEDLCLYFESYLS